MSASITTAEKVLASIQPVDGAGTPILPPPAADAVPVWSTSDVGITTLDVAADGLSATVSGVSAGTATISVSAIFGGQTFTVSDTVAVAAIAPPPPPVVAGIKLIFGAPTSK